jgi:hypothetical protein
MSDKPRGAFMPVHKVLPNSSEPDWDEPTDLDASQDEAETLEDQPEHGGESPADQLIAALLKIKTILDENIEDLNRKGSELFKSSNYAEAQKKAEQGKSLANLQLKAEDLYRDWLLISKEIFSDSRSHKKEISNGVRKRRTAQKLIVQFSDGERIFENSAAETFSKSIAKIGVSKVKNLGIKRLNNPLVSLNPPQKYQSTLADGYYITTHFSTEDKRRLLLEIGEQLGVSLQADLVD